MGQRNRAQSSRYAEAVPAVNVHAVGCAGAIHDAVAGGWDRVRASAFQDQAGSLTITASNDPAMASPRTISTTAISASTWAGTADVLIFKRYVQVKLSNTSGSTDTTICELDVVFTAV